MPIARIDILCECENPHCAKRFGVELGLADEVPDSKHPKYLGDLIQDLVREAIRDGNGTYYTWAVRGKITVDRISLSGPPSIQGNLMLCDACTKKCDADPKEGNLTQEEVEEILGMGLDIGLDEDEE
jgi:hypothetical protein